MISTYFRRIFGVYMVRIFFQKCHKTDLPSWWSVCVQRMNKLVGLFVNAETGLTCVINKASVGLLRPCDVVELLYLDATLDPRCMEDCLADSPLINAGNNQQVALP